MKERPTNTEIAGKKLLRLARGERGSALVEFAMTASMLIAITVGIIGFGLATYTYHFLSAAAQQGERFASLRGHTWSEYTTTSCSTSAPPGFTMVYDCEAATGDVQNYVQSLVPGAIKVASITVTTTWPGQTPDGATTGCSPANSHGCLVKVVVSYTYHFWPFEHLAALPMSATSEGVVLQ